jgi:hypothetical protein
MAADAAAAAEAPPEDVRELDRVLPPTRLVADRIAVALREVDSPPAVLAPPIVAEELVLPVPCVPPPVDADVEAVPMLLVELPIELMELLVEDDEPEPEPELPPWLDRPSPPEEPLRDDPKLRPSRPNPLRLPRICGTNSEEYFSAPVVPVRRSDRTNLPALTV